MSNMLYMAVLIASIATTSSWIPLCYFPCLQHGYAGAVAMAPGYVPQDLGMQIVRAIQADDESAVRELVANSEIGSLPNYFGDTLLGFAVRSGSVKCIEYLLKESRFRDRKLGQDSPMEIARFMRHREILKLLVTSGLSFDSQIERPAYLRFVSECSLDRLDRDSFASILDELGREHERFPNQFNFILSSGLFAAIECRSFGSISLMVTSLPPDTFSAAEKAVLLRNIDELKKLGRDELSRCNFFSGKSLLALAVSLGFHDIAGVLLEAGLPMDEALFAAIAERDHEIIKLLIEHGADANRITRSGWSLLMSAIDYDDAETFEMLLAAGADRSFTSWDGYSFDKLLFLKSKPQTLIAFQETQLFRNDAAKRSSRAEKQEPAPTLPIFLDQ